MARIVLGLGTSHTPMLLASDETLPRFLETDQIISHHDKDGRPTTYGDLMEKANPRIADLVAPAQLVERQNRARPEGRQSVTSHAARRSSSKDRGASFVAALSSLAGFG